MTMVEGGGKLGNTCKVCVCVCVTNGENKGGQEGLGLWGSDTAPLQSHRKFWVGKFTVVSWKKVMGHRCHRSVRWASFTSSKEALLAPKRGNTLKSKNGNEKRLSRGESMENSVRITVANACWILKWNSFWSEHSLPLTWLRFLLILGISGGWCSLSSFSNHFLLELEN